jgi:hypothetical protein
MDWSLDESEVLVRERFIVGYDGYDDDDDEDEDEDDDDEDDDDDDDELERAKKVGKAKR